MATGLVDSGNKMVKRIVLLEGSPEAEATIEAAYQLTKDARTWLGAASETALVVKVTAETGAADITFTSVEESSNGTNFRTVTDITDAQITAVGEYRIPLANRVMAEYVRTLITVGTLSGSAFFTMTIALECTIDSAKYGS